MTESIVDEARYFVPVPAALREVGVLVEPLTIAEKALEQIRAMESRLPEGSRHSAESPHTAVVLGAGPVGLLGAMVLQVAGYQVYVYSRSASDGVRAQVLKAIGATLVAAETHTVEALAETVGNIDLVYEAVGASTLAFEVVKFLGINGTFVFTGVPGRKAPIRLDTDRVMRHMVLRNQVLFGTVNAGRPSYENAVRHLETFMARFPEATRALITSRSPLADAPGLLTTRPAGIKSVVSVT
jgi:threonine dehydrogenase-like Zn-dependent dehydrogenase